MVFTWFCRSPSRATPEKSAGAHARSSGDADAAAPSPGANHRRDDNAAAEDGPDPTAQVAVEPLPPQPPLPEEPDQGLSELYSCEVLRTTKGLLKGCWGLFTPEAMYRALPGGDEEGTRCLRHCLIAALEIERYAEKAGEELEVVQLGEGSFSRVFGSGALAAKVISERERPWVHRAAVKNSLQADRLGLGPCIFGHGTLEQKMGGHFYGTVLLMERLSPLGPWEEADTAALLSAVEQLSHHGFHNDLKLPNILRRGSQPVIIDFDLMAPWSAKVAVTSNCIEHDFRSLLEPLGDLAWRFREYYDLFSFSLSLHEGPLYRAVLQRLQELWRLLELPVLGPLLEQLGPQTAIEVPFEVLVRVPLQGVTVSLFDLRGNLYCHLERNGAKASADDLQEQCGHLPQLMRSNGVYWP